MQANLPLGGSEDPYFRPCWVRAGQPVGQQVVEAQEDAVQLGDDAVLIVARIAKQCLTRRVARQIGGPRVGAAGKRRAKLQVDAVRLVELGRVAWPAAIDRVEVEGGGTEVLQRIRIDGRRQVVR